MTEVQRRMENKQGKFTKYVQNMHMDRNVNMVKHVNLYIKESEKYMQNLGNVDLDKDAIIAMI